MKKILLLLLLLCPQLAEAQTSRNPCYTTGALSSNGILNCIGVGTNTPLPTNTNAPGGSIQGNATGTTGAVVGTLAANATKTTFLCGFDVSEAGTGAYTVTVAGLSGGSKVYQMVAPNTFTKSFNPCVAGSAINTAITITTSANGTATAADVNSDGYQQ